MVHANLLILMQVLVQDVAPGILFPYSKNLKSYSCWPGKSIKYFGKHLITILTVQKSFA
jgi:hypothetical protein